MTNGLLSHNTAFTHTKNLNISIEFYYNSYPLPSIKKTKTKKKSCYDVVLEAQQRPAIFFFPEIESLVYIFCFASFEILMFFRDKKCRRRTVLLGDYFSVKFSQLTPLPLP